MAQFTTALARVVQLLGRRIGHYCCSLMGAREGGLHGGLLLLPGLLWLFHFLSHF
jgi:hypothetical protein